MRRNSRSSLGFTLIEVLVATTILGIGIVSLLGAVSSASSTLARSRDTTVASSLAKAKMEEVLSEKELDVSTESGSFDEPYDRFNWTCLIAEGQEEEMEDWLQVSLLVTWPGGAQGGSFELATRRLKEMPKPLVPVVGAGTGTGTPQNSSQTPAEGGDASDTNPLGFGSQQGGSSGESLMGSP